MAAQFPTLLTETSADRYIAACAFTCTLWDHLVTIHEEFIYIWGTKRRGFTRIVFAWNRYGIEAQLLLFIFYTSGSNPPVERSAAVCKQYIVASGALMFLSIAAGNATVAFRLYNLWERTKAAMITLWIGFAVTYTGVFVSFIFLVKDIFARAYNQQLQLCILTSTPTSIFGVWGFMLAFDLFAIAVATINVLQQPYRHTSELRIRLRRDGITLYLALATSRIITTIATALGPTNIIFPVAYIILVLVSITTTSRIMLRMEAANSETNTGREAALCYEMVIRQPC